jgi:hypothetical protein
MGRPHDLIAFDEAAQLAKSKVQFVIGWNRSTDQKQRCRVILTSTPPTGGEGDWLVEWFAPWLDPKFPNPALPSELRYARTGGYRNRAGAFLCAAYGLRRLPHSWRLCQLVCKCAQGRKRQSDGTSGHDDQHEPLQEVFQELGTIAVHANDHKRRD